jgi:hypothetical protein
MSEAKNNHWPTTKLPRAIQEDRPTSLRSPRGFENPPLGKDKTQFDHRSPSTIRGIDWLKSTARMVLSLSLSQQLRTGQSCVSSFFFVCIGLLARRSALRPLTWSSTVPVRLNMLYFLSLFNFQLFDSSLITYPSRVFLTTQHNLKQ